MAVIEYIEPNHTMLVGLWSELTASPQIDDVLHAELAYRISQKCDFFLKNMEFPCSPQWIHSKKLDQNKRHKTCESKIAIVSEKAKINTDLAVNGQTEAFV